MEKAFIMIKPDGMKKRLAGECLRRLEKADLKINKIQIHQVSLKEAEKLYDHIKIRYPRIYHPLLRYIRETPVLQAVLEGKNAIEKVRRICGPTNPAKAPKGTIRGDYSTGDMAKNYARGKETRNIIHSSDSNDSAKKEIKIFFR
jgi:nucleoside-diphosphate kinase